MILKQVVTGLIENNNYLLIDEKSKEAILVDCSDYEEKIKNILDEYCANLKYILITHGHFDHILGIEEYHKIFPQTKILAPKNDKELIENVENFVENFVGFLDKVSVPPITEYIDENSEIYIGNEKIQIIPTSGHTEGGVCYFVDDKLFSGDTIFLGSVGRTDLPGGSFAQLKKSVNKVLGMFSDDTKIYPGHGDSTTVAYEKANNPII